MTANKPEPTLQPSQDTASQHTPKRILYIETDLIQWNNLNKYEENGANDIDDDGDDDDDDDDDIENMSNVLYNIFINLPINFFLNYTF